MGVTFFVLQYNGLFQDAKGERKDKIIDFRSSTYCEARRITKQKVRTNFDLCSTHLFFSTVFVDLNKIPALYPPPHHA